MTWWDEAVGSNADLFGRLTPTARLEASTLVLRFCLDVGADPLGATLAPGTREVVGETLAAAEAGVARGDGVVGTEGSVDEQVDRLLTLMEGETASGGQEVLNAVAMFFGGEPMTAATVIDIFDQCYQAWVTREGLSHLDDESQNPALQQMAAEQVRVLRSLASR